MSAVLERGFELTPSSGGVLGSSLGVVGVSLFGREVAPSGVFDTLLATTTGVCRFWCSRMASLAHSKSRFRHRFAAVCAPQSRSSLSVTDATLPTPCLRYPYGFESPRMAVDARRSVPRRPSGSWWRASASANILPPRHRLQVLRSHASVVAAQMVKLQPFGDGANQNLIHDSVCSEVLASRCEDAVSVIEGCCPNPTATQFRMNRSVMFINLRPQPGKVVVRELHRRIVAKDQSE